MSFGMIIQNRNMEKNQNYVTCSFIAYIKIDDVYKDIAGDVETKLNTSNYELNILLTKGKNKKNIGVMKNGLVGKSRKNFLD